MNQKYISPYRFGLLLFIVSLLASLYFSSCRKIDYKADKNLPKNWREDFFALPTDASPILKRIASKIKSEDERTGFLENFVKENGFIRWEYADIRPAKKNTNSAALETANMSFIVLLPTVPLDADIVKSIIAAKTDINDVLLKLYQDKKYAAYGFDLSPDRDKPNANDIVQRIMAFHKEIFNDTCLKAFM
jgi:hypothetical protein